MDERIDFYVDPEINRNTLEGHAQVDLDRGVTVCFHFHKRDEPCEDGCEERVPEVVHSNIFDQTK